MGIWDWIVNAFAPGDANEASSRHERTGAVATLEPSDQDGTGNGTAVETVADTTDSTDGRGPWWARQGVDRTAPIIIERPEMPTEARALENLLVSQFDGHDLTLPPLPHVTERVLRRLRDSKCDATVLADDIAEDQVIAAEVLRMSNSVLYRGLSKVTTLKSAVTRLGTTAIRTLMMNQSMRAAIFDRKGGDAELASIVWYRSLASSCVMRELARIVRFDEEEAALIGLLHDIGNVIVLRVINEQQKATSYRIDIETFEYLCHECHQEFGELIAESWQLPSVLKALITDHHGEPRDDDPNRLQRNMIALSDMVCASVGYGPPAEYELLASDPVRALGLAENPRFIAALAALPERIEQLLVSLGGLPDVGKADREDKHGDRALANWLAGIRRGRTSDNRSLGRRLHPRWSTKTTEVAVWVDGYPFSTSVKVNDVSWGGASLSFPEPISIGQSIRVEPGDGETFEGCVVNVGAGPDEYGHYRVGVKFTS